MAAPFAASEQWAYTAGQANVGLALSADQNKQNKFLHLLTQSITGDLPDDATTHGESKSLKSLVRPYLTATTDRFMPLIEALFMIMRGHNIHLEDAGEANKPACAKGAYLNILKAITQTPEIADVASSLFESVEIKNCTPL